MTVPSRGLAWTTIGLATALAAAAPAFAQTAPLVDSPNAREILARYNEATQAAIMCEHLELGQPGETQVAQMAARASGGQYLTGSMLTTIEDARGWMRMIVSSRGCRDPLVMDRLAFFDRQIAPGLH